LKLTAERPKWGDEYLQRSLTAAELKVEEDRLLQSARKIPSLEEIPRRFDETMQIQVKGCPLDEFLGFIKVNRYSPLTDLENRLKTAGLRGFYCTVGREIGNNYNVSPNSIVRFHFRLRGGAPGPDPPLVDGFGNPTDVVECYVHKFDDIRFVHRGPRKNLANDLVRFHEKDTVLIEGPDTNIWNNYPPEGRILNDWGRVQPGNHHFIVKPRFPIFLKIGEKTEMMYVPASLSKASVLSYLRRYRRFTAPA
jgi:hypothetical protein